MCIRDSVELTFESAEAGADDHAELARGAQADAEVCRTCKPVSYTHLRAHETVLDLVCRLLLETKKNTQKKNNKHNTHLV